MAIPHLTELQRLMLRTERDLVEQAQLRTLLTVADTAVATDQQELRTIKTRIKRRKKKAH